MYDRTKPPAELAPHMDDETFKKSQAYGRDKIRYSLFKTIFDQVLNWGMIKMGAFPWAWELAGDALWLFGLSVERTVGCTGYSADDRSPALSYGSSSSPFFRLFLAFLGACTTRSSSRRSMASTSKLRSSFGWTSSKAGESASSSASLSSPASSR